MRLSVVQLGESGRRWLSSQDLLRYQVCSSGMEAGRGGNTFIVLPGAPAEDLEESIVARGFRRGAAQGLDVGRLQQLGEDVGVCGGGGLRDEVDGGPWGGGRFGEEDVGLEGVEGFLLGGIHGGKSGAVVGRGSCGQG